mgnify:CR=1 FL=1
MTVIVAVSGGTRVCMAADSQATANGCKAVLNATNGKIVRRGPLLFGCGHLTVMDAVRYVMPEPEPAAALHEWTVTVFVPWLRGYLHARERMEKTSAGEADFPCHVLVAHKGAFVQADAGTGVVSFERPYTACGSGWMEAIGAMWEAHRVAAVCRDPRDDLVAEYIARAGVEGAIALDAGCGPPVCVEWTEP